MQPFSCVFEDDNKLIVFLFIDYHDWDNTLILFRPVLDCLNLKPKLPKPLISILSLFLSEFDIDSNMALTESSTKRDKKPR